MLFQARLIHSLCRIVTILKTRYIHPSLLQTPRYKGFNACDYTELTEVILPNYGNAAVSGNALANNTYPWSDDLKGRNYPFPAVVRNYDPETKTYGDYLHFGRLVCGGKSSSYRIYCVLWEIFR